MAMKNIHLDATNWKTRDDFYDALLPALGAPAWHGRNLDALEETIRDDNINKVKSPYRLHIQMNAHPTAEISKCISVLIEIIKEAQELAVDVQLILERPA